MHYYFIKPSDMQIDLGEAWHKFLQSAPNQDFVNNVFKIADKAKVPIQAPDKNFFSPPLIAGSEEPDGSEIDAFVLATAEEFVIEINSNDFYIIEDRIYSTYRVKTYRTLQEVKEARKRAGR